MVARDGRLPECGSQMPEQLIARTAVTREDDAFCRDAAPARAACVVEGGFEESELVALFGLFPEEVEHRLQDLELSRKVGGLTEGLERLRLELGREDIGVKPAEPPSNDVFEQTEPRSCRLKEDREDVNELGFALPPRP